MLKDELKKIKSKIIHKNVKKQQLEQEEKRITAEIESLNKKHLKYLDYRRYQNNSNIAVGVITFIGIGYFSLKILNQTLTNSMLISTIPSFLTAEATRTFFFFKRKKIKDANPTIDFKNYDIDGTFEKLMELHNEKMTLSDEISLINSECKKCNECCEQLLLEPENQEYLKDCKMIFEEKKCIKDQQPEQTAKIKVITLNRKK